MLTRAGSVLASAAVAAAVLGSALIRPTLMLFGITLALYLVLEWFVSLTAETALEADKIRTERECGGAYQGSRVLLGRDTSVTVRVENRLPLGLARVVVTDIIPSGLRRITGQGASAGRTRLAPRDTLELSYQVTAAATGAATFGGPQVVATDLFGLVRHERLIPAVKTVHVLPLPVELGGAVARGAQTRQVGQHRLAQRGLGSTLHEIRPYLAGDSLRKIAWKAVARTGRLLTREVESELNVPVTLLIDASPGMRAGRRGHTPLDHVVRVGAIVAATASRAGDPCGLGVFTDRGRTYVAPGVGRRHMVRVLESLSAALTLALDKPSEALMAAYIYGYVHGVDPDRAARVPPWAPGGVHTVVADAYGLLPEDRYRMDSDREFRYACLYRYCRDHGILPPVEPARDRRLTAPGRDRMLLELMKTVLLRAKERELFAIFSDFEGVEASPLLLEALRLARSRYHSVILLTPFIPWFEMSDQSASRGKDGRSGGPGGSGYGGGSDFEQNGRGPRSADELAEEMYALAFRHRRDVLRKAVRQLGIPVRDLAPDRMAAVVLQEVAHLKRDRAVRR